MASRFQLEYDEVEASNMFIREQQRKMSFAFPVTYAPEGRLRETTKSEYMAVMRLFYQFNRSSEDLTLELRRDTEDGLTVKYATVGPVFSADFFWSRSETIRLHIIAARKNHDKVVEHYHVYDMGSHGNAYSIPRDAWDNWMILGDENVGGVGVDKRLIYMAIGDRSQIGNMTVEEFSKLSADQVTKLQDALKPGMFLVRPSLQDAGLDESPRKAEKRRKSSRKSSSDDDDSNKPPAEKRIIPRLGGRSRLDYNPAKRSTMIPRGFATASSSTKEVPDEKKISSKDSKWWKNLTPPPNRFMDVGPNGEMIPLGPDGKPMSKEQAEGLKELLSSFGGFKKIKTPEKEKEVEPEDVSNDSSIFEEETSVEDQGFEMSGVSSLADSSLLSRRSASYDGGPGPLPMNDSVEVFLSSKPNQHEVVNVSTDSSGLDTSRGQANGAGTLDL